MIRTVVRTGAQRTRRTVRVSKPFRGACLLSCVLGAGSCTFVVDAEQTQCDQDSDCVARFGDEKPLFCRQNVCVAPTCTLDADCAQYGDAYAGGSCVEQQCVPKSSEPPEWACLNNPMGPLNDPGPFQVKLHLQHMVSRVSLKDVTARVCQKLDVGCANPESSAVSNADGDVTLTINKGFSGYVSLIRDDLMPTLYFFSPTVDRDTTIAAVQLAEPSVAMGITSTTGARFNAERGLVLLSAFKCDQTTAGGIIFKSPDADAETVTFYAAGGLPSPTATQTENTGFGGFINVPAGGFTIEGERVADGRKTGSVSILVNAGQLTITRLMPPL